MNSDTYKTIEGAAQGEYKERGSKFLAFAYPVSSSDQVKPLVDALRTEHYSARHHCFAYRIGQMGEDWRAVDDGEPSGTAGRPIHGQLMSAEVTNVLVVVVRYFGGTKLGVSGLISAYRDATIDVLAHAKIVERTINTLFNFTFDYLAMNDVMRLVKEMEPVIVEQTFDNTCHMTLSIRCDNAEEFFLRASTIENVTVTEGETTM